MRDLGWFEDFQDLILITTCGQLFINWGLQQDQHISSQKPLRRDVVVGDGLQTTIIDGNGDYRLASDLAKRRFVAVTIPAEMENKQPIARIGSAEEYRYK